MVETSAFDVAAVRAQFPILNQNVEGKPLVYLDNAATTQKPMAVIEAITDFYTQCNANVHRGVHRLADQATQRYEHGRDVVANYIHAFDRSEVIWTSGTTESINIVAHGIAQRLQPGDQVLVTEMEHHANLVTWQQACLKSGAELVIAPIQDNGELNVEQFASLLNSSTKLVAMPHISNALGTVNPIHALTAQAKEVGALVLIDGAQGIAHGGVNVADIGCDFYAFSGHKVFGPTGVGVLWGKAEVLQDWPVLQTGGEMIAKVTYQDATWGSLPNRLEAGTPNIAGVIGLAAAITWFSQFDLAAVQAHERALMERALQHASELEGFQLIGNANDKIGVLSFLLEGCHPADIGFILDKQGIAIRTGDHCAQPLMRRLGVPGTARASFSIYNTIEEIDALFIALKKAQQMLV
ncbi:SufS family cysteine desulfurase [Vibrio sp. V31_P5A7T61]|uniref:aminotransferase class V-fold PLP-dependent enzyme n=1 Tax=unclassified Vibrio TaxID=2614977 RepID=UPI001372BB65|nr:MULTISPECIES: cysteine desulfurase [unclassified Vibrio]NAW61312.1 SufS family cysteine desulfurase [Vibrio sp. V31_P5A7T61]NAX02507.1 SufS family cysteine desulfurase [Vibrio sp. V34_P3A8T189]NAX09240.1 SufS family cysteine desulfurase [Vibrio sp. V40_P2S30T141]NAX65394.1 SufS family cysteine desulfurase [Vibrio sp. V32_P6A28T40]